MRLNLWRGRQSPVEIYSLNGSGRADVAGLESIAATIPSMGGREIGPFLREVVAGVPSGSAVVELGSWLGAGTAQAAIGVSERGNDIEIHCFDQWRAIPHEVRRAASLGNLRLYEGQDTLPMVMKSLAPFPAKIVFHKGDLRAATWSARPISLHIDDACKKPSLFYHALRTFGPSWIPGETIVALMDFHYWKKTKSKTSRCQRDFVERHNDHFEAIERDYFNGHSWGIFRYTKKIDFRSAVPENLFSRVLGFMCG